MSRLLYAFATTITLIYLCSINQAYATSQTPHLSYGGVVNMTFGRLAGENKGQNRPSGYGWVSSYHKLNDTYYVTGNAGVSLLEGKPVQDPYDTVKSVYTPILNDLNIDIHSNIEQFIIGRTLNAAGKMHHDISDFGAPGGGMDNAPVTSFKNGSYTTNVAQQIANTYAQRVAYYLRPFENDIALGISYAHRINPYNPEHYEFFAGTEKPVKKEISVTVSNTEIYIKGFFIGVTVGHTQARRPFNNQKPQGKITANQFSLVVKEKLPIFNHYRLYEANIGCLNDKQTSDCRLGYQISKIENDHTSSMGVQISYSNDPYNPIINTDFSMGQSLLLNKNLKIGFETILRRQETKKKYRSDQDGRKLDIINTDFNWLAGVQYRF